MDRLYTSLSMIQHLTNRGFETIGTVMKNRASLNDDITSMLKELLKGHSKFYCSNDKKMMLTLWKDSKIVLVLSNTGNNSTGETRRYSRAHGSLPQTVSIPNIIKEFAKSSRGVDYLDQMMSYYSSETKSRKWYMAVVIHLIEIALHNSLVLYNKIVGKKIRSLDFRKTIIESLISEYRDDKLEKEKQKKKKCGEMIIESEQDCELAYNPKMKCLVCAENKLSKFSNYWCKAHKSQVCFLVCYDYQRKKYKN